MWAQTSVEAAVTHRTLYVLPNAGTVAQVGETIGMVRMRTWGIVRKPFSERMTMTKWTILHCVLSNVILLEGKRYVKTSTACKTPIAIELYSADFREVPL